MPKEDIFPCNENGRVLTFKTEAQNQAHMDTGKHVRKLERKSVFDEFRKKWAERVTGERLLTQLSSVLGLKNDQPSTSSSASPITNANGRRRGWILKVMKKPRRMVSKVKAFLVRKFDERAHS